MNLLLRNIGDIDSDNNISRADALIAPSGVFYDYVLANPPFGKNEQSNLYQRRRRTGKGISPLQLPELLRNHAKRFFLWLLSFRQGKGSDKKLKGIKR